MKIPADNRWTQVNDGDLYGVLNASFNLDFSTNKGKVGVSPRMVITTDDIANLGVPVGFLRFNNSTNGNGIYATAGDRLFNTDTTDPSDAFTASTDNVTTLSSDVTDLMFFKKANRMVASSSTSIVNLTSSSGVSTVGGTPPPLTGGTVHMMCEYGNRLYCTDNLKTIISFDTSMSVTAAGNANTFSLGTLDTNQIGLRMVDIIAASDKIWILTATSQHGEGAVIHAWDGATQDDPTNSYLIDSSAIMCGVLVEDNLYIITGEAELMVFNGGAFVRVPNGRLPVNRNKYLDNTFSSVNDRWIHPNGIIVTDEGKINILINNVYEDGTVEEQLPSGIWEFDTKDTTVGWRHINSLSLSTSTISDYGQNRVSRVGALFYIKTPTGDGTYLAGAQLYSNASSTKEVIETNNTDDNIQKYGYLVTQKIYSPNVQDSWQKVYARFKRFMDVGDSITVKYRSNDAISEEYTATWTSTSTFTIANDVRHWLGYEAEVLQGTGGGKCAQVSSVSYSGGTSTVTLDDTFTGVTTGTFKVRFQNWIKSGTFSSQDSNLHPFGIDKTSTWIQFKVCMQFKRQDELDDLVLINSKHE